MSDHNVLERDHRISVIAEGCESVFHPTRVIPLSEVPPEVGPSAFFPEISAKRDDVAYVDHRFELQGAYKLVVHEEL